MSGNIGILFSNGVKKHFYAGMKDYDPSFRRFMHVETTDSRVVDHQLWQERTLPLPRVPGERIAMSSINPSFSKRYTALSWGLGDSFSKEDLADDPTGVLMKAIPSTGGQMAKLYNALMEQEAKYMFGTQGFASGTVVGSPDGKSLFNTAHPMSALITTTWANRPTVDTDLAFASAQAGASALRVQKRHNGIIPIQNEVKCCVFHPNQIYVAKAIWKAPMERGTADNNKNFLTDDNVDLVPWPYWEVSGATGTYNAWFLAGREHYAFWFMRQQIDAYSWFEGHTNSQIVTTNMRAMYGWSDPRGFYGSKGS